MRALILYTDNPLCCIPWEQQQAQTQAAVARAEALAASVEHALNEQRRLMESRLADITAELASNQEALGTTVQVRDPVCVATTGERKEIGCSFPVCYISVSCMLELSERYHCAYD